MPVEMFVDAASRPFQAQTLTLSMRLGLECAYRGWSAEQAAAVCGVTAERFEALREGGDLPTVHEMAQLAAVLGDDDERHLLASLKQLVRNAARMLWPRSNGAIPRHAAAERLAELAPRQREVLARGLRVAAADFSQLLNAMRRTERAQFSDMENVACA